MKRKILLVLLALATVLCLIFALPACAGGSNNGTYYLYENSQLDKTQYITIDGSSWTDDDGESGDVNISGNTITLYIEFFGEKEEFASGTIGDGVLTLNIMGAQVTYCKEGQQPSDDSDNGGTVPAPSAQYTVTYDANGGQFANGMSTYEQTNIAENSTLTAPASPTRANWTFSGWATDKNGTEMWNFSTNKVTNNTTLYAVWSQRSAEILSVDGASIEEDKIFMLVDHSTSSISLSNKVVCSEDSIWRLYYDKLGQTEIPTKIAAGISGSLNSGDNIFYIVVTSSNGSQVNVYELNVYRSYSVTVSYVDGENTINTDYCYTGSLFTANYVPSIKGYTFNYWKTSDGKEFTSDTLWGSLVLYADKTANSYEITLDVNGGNPLTTTEKTVKYDSSYSLTVPSRTGYSFTGWYSGNTKLTDEKGKSLAVWSYSEDKALKAQWSANEYLVTLNKNDNAAGTVTGAGDHKYNSSVTITATTNNGYNFLGWYDKDDNLLSEDNRYTFTMGFDTTFTAKWDYYTLTTQKSIDAAGSITSYTDQKISVGKTVTLTASTNNGYTWCGWYDGEALISNEFEYSFTMARENLNLTAKWIESTVSVLSSDTLMGTVSGLTNSNNILGNTIEVTATNANLGYNWLGWYNNDDLLTKEFSYTFEITETPITYTAKYELDSAMENFTFTSTTSTCNITGVSDKNITQIIVPDYVTSISGGAFSGCSSLESITLPFVGGSIKSPDDTYQHPFGYIFGTSSYTGGVLTKQRYYGSSTNTLTSTTYYIPASLKSATITGGNILSGAFYGCSSLTSITIGDSVTFIGGGAFSGCNNIIEIENGISYVDKWVIDCTNSVTSVSLRTNTVGIADSAFYGCSSLTSITIPDSVAYIGSQAFTWCSSLTSITIPDSVTSIGRSAFENCDSLTSVTIGDGVTSIGDSAFSSCTSLTSITIPDSVTAIGAWAFHHCTSLTSITIPDSVTAIGAWAFNDCESITSITIPDSVTSIGSGAFSRCVSLESITIPDSVTSIGDSAFKDCRSLTSITIPDSVTSIGSGAFGDCYSLANITIPDSVTSIGSGAFGYCYSLASITIPDSVTSIGYRAFYNCTALTSITIPDSVTSIGNDAFLGCTSLETVYYTGSVEQWNEIGIGFNNSYLTRANIVYNYEG